MNASPELPMTETAIMRCVVLAACVRGAMKAVKRGLVVCVSPTTRRAQPVVSAVVRARHMGTTRQQHDRLSTAAEPRDTHRPSYESQS